MNYRDKFNLEIKSYMKKSKKKAVVICALGSWFKITKLGKYEITSPYKEKFIDYVDKSDSYDDLDELIDDFFDYLYVKRRWEDEATILKI